MVLQPRIPCLPSLQSQKDRQDTQKFPPGFPGYREVQTEKVEQERLMVIAAYALWQLRDLDPAGEPADFKSARLELRRRLRLGRQGDGPDLGVGDRPQRPHLRVVR